MVHISSVPEQDSRGYFGKLRPEPGRSHEVEDWYDKRGESEDAEEKTGPELYAPPDGQEEDPPHEDRGPWQVPPSVE